MKATEKTGRFLKWIFMIVAIIIIIVGIGKGIETFFDVRFSIISDLFGQLGF